MPRNRQILLRSRPAGMPSLENFEMIERPMPEPKEEEVLTRTLFLSLDPYMRGRMSDTKSYATPVALGNVMEGQTIGQVVVSRHSGLAAGDLVLGQGNWQEYASIPGKTLRKLDPALTPGSTALGVLGMPGLTAYVGLLDIGQPRSGETVVVSAASGAVGSIVGQIAKIKGCRVVGIAGGSAKCRYVVDELGFEAGIDHRSPDFSESLTKACPGGVDIYFENVGGAVQRAVWPCSTISLACRSAVLSRSTTKRGPHPGLASGRCCPNVSRFAASLSWITKSGRPSLFVRSEAGYAKGE